MMRKLQFISTNKPDLYAFSGEAFLYNSTAYLQLKAAKFGPPLTFYALDGEVAVARIHFFLQKKSDGSLQAVSLPESPFGSLEYGEATHDELTAFLDYVIDKLRSKEVKLITINDCIAAYRYQDNISVENLLLEAGFIQQASLPNHHVVVGATPLENQVHSMERRRIKKCRKAGFSFVQQSLAPLAEHYNFILNCRIEKGRSLSLTLKDLSMLVSAMPSSYLLFSTYDDQLSVASALCVRVNPLIVYVFYPASRMSYNNFSPMVFLLNEIYAYCQRSGYHILDLGTSNSDSVAHFKKHMGGQQSLKYTYYLKV